MAQHISYRTVKVDGLSIFYREAGPKDGPSILLLHGLPSSSRMFEPLLTVARRVQIPSLVRDFLTARKRAFRYPIESDCPNNWLNNTL